MDIVIMLTRLNGPEFALNPDLIERVESTPDTVVSLVDGKKYVITESVSELVRRVRLHRAAVLALAHELEASGALSADLPGVALHPDGGDHSSVADSSRTADPFDAPDLPEAPPSSGPGSSWASRVVALPRREP